ncbi:hypothetical protein ACIQNU_14675 [Streptomyces sp. NPDC091292]|uniref:hypothetical protein n=1 Tax=Streptomyces sp. NPDC091292 TaxID=3365991 RepID=UPI003824EE27
MESIRRAVREPAYAEILARHLVESGEAVVRCGRRGGHLTMDQMEAVCAIDGGPGADDDLFLTSWCTLRPRHSGPHYRLLRHLTGTNVVWVRWLGPLSEVVTLSDCIRSPHDDFACPLFAGHAGTCPTPRTA